MSSKVKVGINGFGRIGRCVLRAIYENPSVDLEIVAINDLMAPEQVAFLFKHDSTMGRFAGEVSYTDTSLIVDGHEIKVVSEKDPANLPWAAMGVELVLECTGLFTDAEKAKAHITAGAKKVLISAPAKNEDITLALGINDDKYDPAQHHIISNASCTTNCLGPMVKILHEKFGIVSGMMTTIHSYTGDQRLLDAPHADLRRARSAAMNIVPTSTGAAKAIGLVMPELKGKLDGYAIRVPTPNVSMVDLVINTDRPVTKDAVNQAFRDAAQGSLQGIMDYTEDPVVSTDFLKDPHSCIIDGQLTMTMGTNTLKVFG